MSRRNGNARKTWLRCASCGRPLRQDRPGIYCAPCGQRLGAAGTPARPVAAGQEPQ